MRAAVAALIFCFSARSATAEVQISLHDGRVSLKATNATVPQILSEWARVGRATFVNIERTNGEPLTLQLVDMPEAQALDVLLRSFSGYMAMGRSVAVPDASIFERIVVMPQKAPPAVAPRIAAGDVNELPAPGELDKSQTFPREIAPPARLDVAQSTPVNSRERESSAPSAPSVVQGDSPVAVAAAARTPVWGSGPPPHFDPPVPPSLPTAAAAARPPAAGAPQPAVVRGPPLVPGQLVPSIAQRPQTGVPTATSPEGSQPSGSAPAAQPQQPSRR